MGIVLSDMSMSLDGFVAGPNIGVANPMGEGGMRLHQWMFSGSPDDSAGTVGAVVLGARTYDVGKGHWGGTPYPAPSFVLTHHAHEDLPVDHGTFHFVADGPQSAVKQAQAAAGDDNVVVMGADTTRQVLAAGLLDELHIHLVPVLLGGGTRLFEGVGAEHVELEQISNKESSDVTHLRYRARK
jgi:dihydrofolate reductase